eukprot:4499508-Prymnesium_polylepis.1
MKESLGDAEYQISRFHGHPCKAYGSPGTGGGRAHPGHHCGSRTRGRGRGRDARGAHSSRASINQIL